MIDTCVIKQSRRSERSVINLLFILVFMMGKERDGVFGRFSCGVIMVYVSLFSQYGFGPVRKVKNFERVFDFFG